MSRKYEKVQELLPIIKERVADGKTQKEIAEEFGLKDKYVVKGLLKRERRKERKLAAGFILRPQGRPRKDAAPKDVIAEQTHEIRRLKRENELVRDFLSLIRKE